MRPSQTFRVLEDLGNPFQGPLHREGIELSLDDSQTVLEVYQQWILLMIDLGYLHHGTLLRDARRLLTDMLAADVLDLNNAFAELLRKVYTRNNKGFKAPCKRISTHLYNLIKDDVSLLSDSDVYAARRLVQCFSYTSRLTLHKIDLTQQCLEDYMATEDNMSTYLPEGLCSSLNKIIRGWMKSFDPANLRFSHSSGGVAGHGRTSLNVKYDDLTFDALTTYAFGAPWWCEKPIPSTLDRISHTIFVPKSYKTFRTISMESSTLMYLQQGVLREIDRVVESDWWLRTHIGTHDQTRNQQLAKEGSISRNFATIDLSAASDSVSYSLVKKLFRGTKLLRYLVATRSSRTLLPDGRLINLKKFAPMGSALCFPVETIIFAAICQYVTREHGVTSKYSVYGDDIIVPTQCAEDVINVLETLGFRVNTSKSFYDETCWFRESCGGEYVDGFDVTPVKVSRQYNDQSRLDHLSGLIENANRAYVRGYRNLRYFYLAKMRAMNYKPLFSPIALLGDSYTNYHLAKRWRRAFQRFEVRATGFDSEMGKYDESVRYRHWLETTADRKPPRIPSDGQCFESIVGRVTVFLQDRWFRKPYVESDQLDIDLRIQRGR